MSQINKQLLLAELEAQTESHLSIAIEILQNLSEESLSKPASNGGWSIAQVMAHLNSYGDFYLPTISNKIKSASPSETKLYVGSLLGTYFRDLMNPDKNNSKFKAFQKHTPDIGVDPANTIATFISQEEKLLELIRKSVYYDIQKIKIPLSITNLIQLRLGDVFQFIVAHNERHIRQAKRNL